MTEPVVSRRERKKAATRQSIADAALELFLERGYEHVSIREIADAADVSTATVFKHFTGKEALVFDREESTDAQLIAAVRERAAGQSVLDALRGHVLDTWLPFAADPQSGSSPAWSTRRPRCAPTPNACGPGTPTRSAQPSLTSSARTTATSPAPP